ncbi:MAG: protein-L-isoaspartate O-methyltransferase [Candidatus Parcubacteria bacterium]|nr:protein-L-isoaspartate O-methyltransferase [Candidatus Parcubacteria bacterium]
MTLINELIEQGWLKTDRIIKAFKEIKREDFIPEDIKNLSEINEALSIGFGQTISQPLVVAFMLEKLEPKPGDKILDIGSGSGWTSTLLASIVGDKGKVIGIEIIPELKEFGQKNASNYDFIKNGILKFVCSDGRDGYLEEALYDAILCSAGTDSVPSALKNQLKIGGKIVIPIHNSICVFTKKSEDNFEKQEYPGFVFVPLVKNKNV